MINRRASFALVVGGSFIFTAGCGSNSDTPAGVGTGGTGTGGIGVVPPGSGGTSAGTGGAAGSLGTGNAGAVSAGGVVGNGGTVGVMNGGQSSSGGASTGGSASGGSSAGGAGSGGDSSGGAGGAGGAGTGGAGTGGASGAGGGGGAPAMNPCIAKQSQIVLIGDSYITGFSGTPALQPAIAQILPSAAMWRNYAIAGISMAQGGIPLGAPAGVAFVPDEFTEALAADKDIKLVIMDGGGNDALIPPAGSPAANCKNNAMSATDPNCQALVSATLMAADKLVMKMADSGVKNMIYFFYPHLPGTGVLSGTAPNAILDYSEPIVQKECESAFTKTSGKLSCDFLDLRPAFGSDYAANISGDGVHPTAAGQVIIATQITNLMKSKCLGQSSGCCAP